MASYSFAQAPGSVPVPVRSVKEVNIVAKSKLLQDYEKETKRRATLTATGPKTSESLVLDQEWLPPGVDPQNTSLLGDVPSDFIEDDPSLRFDRLPQPFRRVANIVEGLLTNVFHEADQNVHLRRTDPVYQSTQAEAKLDQTPATEEIPLEGFTVASLCGVRRRDQFATLLGCSDGSVRMLRHGYPRETLVWSGAQDLQDNPAEARRSDAPTDTKAVKDKKDKGAKDKGKDTKPDKKKGTKTTKDALPESATEPEDLAQEASSTAVAGPALAVKCIGATATSTMDIVFAVWIQERVTIVRMDSAGDCHVEARIDVEADEVAGLTFSDDAYYLMISYKTTDTIEVYRARSDPGDAELSGYTIAWAQGVRTPKRRTPLFTIPRPLSAVEIEQSYLEEQAVVEDDDAANVSGKGGKVKDKGKGKGGGASSGKGVKKEPPAVPKRGGGGGARAPKGAVTIPDQSADDTPSRIEAPTVVDPHTAHVVAMIGSRIVISWRGLLDVEVFHLPTAADLEAFPLPPPTEDGDAVVIPALEPQDRYLVPSPPTCATRDYDHAQVAFGLRNGTAAVLDTATGRMHRGAGDGHNTPVTAIAFDRTGTIIIGCEGGEVSFTAVQQAGGDATTTTNRAPHAATEHLLTIASGHVLAVARDGATRVLDVRDGSVARLLPLKAMQDPSVGPLLLSTDGGGSLVAIVHHKDGSASIQVFDSLQAHTELVLDLGGGGENTSYGLGVPRAGHVRASNQSLGNPQSLRATPSVRAGGRDVSRVSSQNSLPPVWGSVGGGGGGGSQVVIEFGQAGRPSAPPSRQQRHVRVADDAASNVSRSSLTKQTQHHHQQQQQVVPHSQLHPDATPAERARARVRDVVQDRASRAMRTQMRRSVLKEIAAEL